MIKTIADDPRPIQSIWWDDAEDSHYKVGVTGTCLCTAIKAYTEEAPFSQYAPWLAVFNGDAIIARVPAWKVTIQYEV